jgi:hypothetical protein
MIVELPPLLLSTLERVNDLHMAMVREDDAFKAKHLKEDCGRECVMLLTLLNEAVAASEAALDAATK